MALLSTDRFLARLSAGKTIPSVLLLGQEPYLRDICRTRLLESFLPQDLRQWAVSRYSCAEDRLDAPLAQAQTSPMLAPRQIIFLEDVEALASLPDHAREQAEKRLAAYLRNPAPFTILVFEAAALDQRTRIAKLLLEQTLAVDVGASDDPASRRQAALAAAKTMAAELGVRFEPDAAEELAELVDGELTRLKTEVHKLAAYALPSQSISREAVAALVVSMKRYTVWQLAEMMAARRKPQALEFLAALLREGEDPVGLVAALAWMLRKLIEASELPASAAGWQAARALAVRAETAELALRCARQIPRERLLDGLRVLYEADNRLKLGNANPRAVVEFLVCRLSS